MHMFIVTVIPAGFFGFSQSDNSCLWSATPLVQLH